MDDTTTVDPPVAEAPADTSAEAIDATDGIDEELLIEEVSIDGMCGVY
jgi:mycofactocin precursor